jgi:hypothetical protein
VRPIIASLTGVRDVDGDRRGPAAGLPHLVGDRVALGGHRGQVGDRHVEAVRGEAKRDPATDAAGRARDDRDPSPVVV